MVERLHKAAARSNPPLKEDAPIHRPKGKDALMKNPFFQKLLSASLIAIIAVSLAPVRQARAATLTVTTNAGGAVAIDGQCSLREAIINANNDAAVNPDCGAGTGADTIVFSGAVGTITVAIAALPNITDVDGLTIDGGGTVTVDGGGAFRIFNVTGGAFAVQNITLSNGQVNGNGGAILYAGGVGLTVSSSTFNANRTITNPVNNGGAVYHTNGTLAISNSVFDGNYTQNDGGAVYIANGVGTMTILNSVFTNQNNAAIDNGAALHLLAGTLEINGGNFTGNHTTNGDGGAIFQDGGSLTVGNTASVSFINNSSSGNGGAISNDAGDLTVTGTFTGNSGSYGGALFYTTAAGTFTVSNSTFTNNTAIIGNAGAIRSGGNFTLANSTFTNNSAVANGGAIWHTTNSLSISGSAFNGNFSTGFGDGGAIFIVSATGVVNVDNTNFTNQNSATIDDGGGVYLLAGTLELNGGGFTGNSASGNGGGIAVGAGGALTIGNTSGVNFSNNTAGGGGGAVYHNGNSSFSVSNSNFLNNSAINAGAMFIASALASLNVSNSAFTGNAAQDDGGAIVNQSNPAVISNSLFQNNSISGVAGNTDGGAISNTAAADGTVIRLSTFIGNSVTNTANNNARGGAIANAGTNFILANTTFSGNSVSETGAAGGNAQGGAVWSNDNAIIHNATFSGNSANDTGTGAADGGILFQNAGTLTVANTILSGGTENGAAGNCGGVITDGGNNISFSSGDCGGGFANSDPLLGALAGSPPYFPLNAGSPALNAGNNAICANAASTNNQSQNGVARPVGVNCEIGSYEASNSAPTGGDGSVTANEDTTYTFTVADFTTLTAPPYADVDGDPFSGIRVTALETAGTLQCLGVDVPLNGTCANVTTLTFAPASNANGAAYATFDFEVYDGALYSAASYTMTINITPVNDAPGETAAPNQYRTDAVTLIPQGGTTNETQAVFRGTATDIEGDQYTLEVEVAPTSGAFSNTATCTSPFANSGVEANTGPCGPFPSDSYMWQYRFVDSGGAASPWTPFAIGDPDFIIDTGGPTVINVTSPTPDGTYFPGAVILIEVVFSETVNVTGVPQLTLELGAVDGIANYLSGSGTNTLTFTYTVVTGDVTPDLDYVAAGSLALNGGTIRDVALNDANLSLPTPGAPGSLGDNKGIVIDAALLQVPLINSTPDTGDGNVAEGETISTALSISQLIAQFNKDVYDPAGDMNADDVTNPANYRLLYSTTGVFNTLGCVGGVVAPDIPIPVISANYNNGGGLGPFIATLNLSAPLTTVGYYRLYICGTTSIVQANNPLLALAGNGIANATDFVRNFQLVPPPTTGGDGGGDRDSDKISSSNVSALPATGFAPNRVTLLPEQPVKLAYADLGNLWIEIPALGVKTPIVGVPQSAEGEWDVTWLANNVGWLNGTAFPTWEGNSVMTAHVVNADGLDGPFANLRKLKYGDQIIVHLYGEKYTFEVTNSRLSRPYTTGFAFEDLEEESYLTLITCQLYLPSSDTYFFRRVVRAVLVSVENE
ncbi:MAG: sortase [Anaerolineales bacterium]|nr:sortase [Anaerolineales bacterium]